MRTRRWHYKMHRNMNTGLKLANTQDKEQRQQQQQQHLLDYGNQEAGLVA